MKHYIKSLWNNHREEIAGKSFLNCHCKNVHSIMLLDSPERTIRLYVADVGNTLYLNMSDNFPRLPMSVGFHAHHCDLILHCIKGMLMNWQVEDVTEGNDVDNPDGFIIKKYLYDSKITCGKTQFQKAGESKLKTIKNKLILKDEAVSLKASDIHTVSCAPDQVTAWLVYEGKEDLDYKPYCWSNAKLEEEDLTGLYQKPTAHDVERLLILAGLL